MRKRSQRNKQQIGLRTAAFNTPDDNAAIVQALKILEERLIYKREPQSFQSPDDTKAFLKLQQSELKSEVFGVLFLDNQNRLIAYEVLFKGTIDGCSVYPREVIKAALKHNAAALILGHNHPSGNPHASQADIRLTRRLKEALAFIDVPVLDHIITGETQESLAERGLM